MDHRAELRRRIRELIRLRNPHPFLVRDQLGEPAHEEGGFLPFLLPALSALAPIVAPAAGKLLEYGVNKLTGNGVRKPSAWNEFVREFRASHPHIPSHELFKAASAAYRSRAHAAPRARARAAPMARPARKPRAHKPRAPRHHSVLDMME